MKLTNVFVKRLYCQKGCKLKLIIYIYIYSVYKTYVAQLLTFKIAWLKYLFQAFVGSTFYMRSKQIFRKVVMRELVKLSIFN